MFAASFVPYLSYIACALIGFGMVPCQMVPLYNVMVMKSYPSRYLAPCTIGLALIAVLVQSSIVEMFRNAATMLYLIYAVIMVVLVIIYLQIEPFFLYTFRRKMLIAKDSSPKNEKQIYDDDIPKNNILGELSRREMEVVDLIGQGYSNKDIAKMLFISEHTVKDHTKNIYRKMNVHSRLELAALVSKLKNEK
ncbi:MAG: helix-turn-helix transcriptional regulator [Christensenellaceae bacterium]|nr:helix-turn-helix transcriptional regulator [Christensenellaceae bacterium]